MPHFPVLERVLFDPWPPAPRIHVSSYSRIAASRVDDNGDNDVSVTNRASLFLSSLLRVETRISPPMEMIQENFEQFQRLAPFVSDNFALIHLEHSRQARIKREYVWEKIEREGERA